MMKVPIQASTRRQQIIDLVILFLLAFIVLGRSLNIYFISDNISHILKAWGNLANPQYYYYRPVVETTLILDRFIHGMEPAGFHLTNLLLHIINTMLVYILAGKIINQRFFAFSAALIFLLHPIHSLNIFWISGRTDMVCALFFLIALIAFINYQKHFDKKWLFVSVAAFVSALFSKEMALSLPLIVGAYLFVIAEGHKRKKIILVSVYFSIAIVFLLIKYMLNENVLSNTLHSNINPLHLIKNTAAYIGLLIVPGGHLQIGAFLKANPWFFLILSVSVIVFLLITFKWWRKSKWLVFFMVVILVSLIPVLRLLMRWYLYIPSIGFAFTLAYLLFKWYGRSGLERRLSIVAMILILMIYTVFLLKEQERWLDAGRLSGSITEEIAGQIIKGRLSRCLILNLPAELKETPVLMYGLESFINFRLGNDFDSTDSIKISVAAHVSLAQENDLKKMDVEKLQRNVFRISIPGSASFFIFPGQAALVSQKTRLSKGMVFDDPLFQIKIEEINRQNEAVQILLKLREPQIPVLYYSQGKLSLQ